jgi:prevent-host-death family protein
LSVSGRVATIATEVIMTTIPHRELRNQSSKILERVKNGETIDVTNNGEIAAILIPPSASPFERLLLAVQVRPAAPSSVDFQAMPRFTSDAGTAEILADLRGDR